jgi:hypothetical protein
VDAADWGELCFVGQYVTITVTTHKFAHCYRFSMPQSKLSKLQRWILTETLKCGELPKVRVMANYFSLPTREVRSHYHSDLIPVVDRQSLDAKRYANAAYAMNRSLKRLEERGLIKLRYQHYSSVITLTASGVTNAQTLVLVG